MAVFKGRAFQTISDNGFANAKKLATLTLKKDKLNNDGKNTTAGYEQAMAIIAPFQVSSNEKQSLDAQNIFTGYEVVWQSLSEEALRTKTTTEEFKLQEQEIYWRHPGDISDEKIRDPLELIRGAAIDLGELELAVQGVIEARSLRGENTASLQNYLIDLNDRGQQYRDLWGRIVDGEVIPGETIDGFAYIVDADQNDEEHRVNRVGIVPTSNPPTGMLDGLYRINENANIGGGLMPVRGRISTVKDASNNFVSYIGGAKYDTPEKGSLLMRSGKSSIKFEEDNFSINRNDIGLMGNDIKRGTFSKGFTGVDTNGDAVESYFFVGSVGNVFSLDKKSQSELSGDPLWADKYKNARILSPSLAKGFLSSSEIKPLSQDKLMRENRISELSRPPLPLERKESPGFFETAGKLITGARQQRGFSTPSERKNVPNQPEEATGEVGFFQKAKGFFSSRGGRTIEIEGRK